MTPLDGRPLVSNPPVTDTMDYDLMLVFEPCSSQLHGKPGFHVYPYGWPFLPTPEKKTPWDAHIPLSTEKIYNAVEDVVQAWHDKVIHWATDMDCVSRKPFQQYWDLASRPQFLRAVGPEVREAGSMLFQQLFRTGDKKLRDLFDHLSKVMAERPLVIKIISHELFVPWGLLFTGTNSDASPDSIEFWDGFWGARHVIDQETVEYDERIVVDGGDRIPTGLAVNENLEVFADGGGMSRHVKFFQDTPRLQVAIWRNKPELRTALKLEAFSQAILYFCCHGLAQGEVPPSILLTDGEPIKATEIDYWLDQKVLKSHPVVFLNACEGGVMRTRFYETFAPQFLKRGVAGVLGAYCQLPALFAAQYAQAFFERFLRSDTPKQRIGPLMRDLTRQFIQLHNNPLGLVYVLYRASDVYVDWQGRAEEPAGDRRPKEPTS
jgi:CHAT domain